jgi:hypothetical protein
MSGKVPQLKATQIRKAKQLYKDFSGHEGDEFEYVKKPEFPDAVIVIGELEAVIYSTVRDDEHERYIHKFRQESRALLCISPDGDQLFIVGGKYQFTDRGIVDK